MRLQSAADQYRRQGRLTAVVLRHTRKAWQQIDYANLDQSWPSFAAQALPVLTAGQRAAAEGAAASVGAMLAEQNNPVDPAGEVNAAKFAGIASDGRPLDTLLYQPVIRVKSVVGMAAGDGLPGWFRRQYPTGDTKQIAMASGAASLDRIVVTQMMDAARRAAGVGIAARHGVGYVRMLNPPSCSRCAILAGVWYRWRADFERHVSCDCTQIPAAEDAAGDLRTDPSLAFERGQVRGLSQAETQAVNEGADLNQVVNAHRGMSTATLNGRRFAITREGVTRFGSTRLTVGQIYRDATSRESAIQLLRRFGYII